MSESSCAGGALYERGGKEVAVFLRALLLLIPQRVMSLCDRVQKGKSEGGVLRARGRVSSFFARRGDHTHCGPRQGRTTLVGAQPMKPAPVLVAKSNGVSE
jgi:hypothetical protein